MKSTLLAPIPFLGCLTATGCGSHASKLKDADAGTDGTDLYRYSPNESPGFRVQDLPGLINSDGGVSRGADGLTWRKAGTGTQECSEAKEMWPARCLTSYNTAKPEFLFSGPFFPIDAGGALRDEIDFEAFESFVNWDIFSVGTSLAKERIRYEADQPITGAWFRKTLPVGEGFPSLEVRGYVEDIKQFGSRASPKVQAAFVPSVKIKQVRIIHKSPRSRVNAGIQLAVSNLK